LKRAPGVLRDIHLNSRFQWLVALGWPTILAVLVALAWFEAGSDWLLVVLLMGGGLSLCLFLGWANTNQMWLSRDGWQDPVRRRWFIGLLLFVVTVVGVPLAIHIIFPQAAVHVDNFSGEDVSLELDGKPWRVVPDRKANDMVRLRKGSYALVVKSLQTGDVLDQRQIAVDGAGHYVLNVLAKAVYARGTAHYGEKGRNAPPEQPEQRIQEHWFRADVQHLFENPPNEITVRSSESRTRSYLRRGEPRVEKAPHFLDPDD
jgi:hypothetical protein